MSLPKRLGITLPVPPDVDACMAWALWAEERGIDAIWFADTGGADSLTLELDRAICHAYTIHI